MSLPFNSIGKGRGRRDRGSGGLTRDLPTRHLPKGDAGVKPASGRSVLVPASFPIMGDQSLLWKGRKKRKKQPPTPRPSSGGQLVDWGAMGTADNSHPLLVRPTSTTPVT